jgi:hypothetical protein
MGDMTIFANHRHQKPEMRCILAGSITTAQYILQLDVNSFDNVQGSHNSHQNTITLYLLLLQASSLHLVFGGQDNIELNKLEGCSFGETTPARLSFVINILVFLDSSDFRIPSLSNPE